MVSVVSAGCLMADLLYRACKSVGRASAYFAMDREEVVLQSRGSLVAFAVLPHTISSRRWQSLLILYACYFACISAAGNSGAGDSVQPNDSFMYDSGTQLYWPSEQTCGVLAIHIVLESLHLDSSLHDIRDAVPVSELGTSMQAITQYLHLKALDAVAIQIESAGLSTVLLDHPNTVAIAWLNRRHWVAVVPSQAGDKVEYFDYPNWHPVAGKQFDSQYSGRAIIIRSEGAYSALRTSYFQRLGSWFLVAINVTLLLLLLCPAISARTHA